MKKLCVFVMTLCVILSIGVFADSQLCQTMKIYAQDDSDTVTASVFITKGTGIVGHFGVKYNTEKLELVRLDGTKLPDEVTEQDADGSSYLTKIVKAPSEDVIITPDSNKMSELLQMTKGQLLFGWYSAKNVVVSPSVDGGKIADIMFKLKDGVKAEDIAISDFAFVTKSDCDGISGWSGGIITIASDEKAYSAQSDDEQSKLELKIELLMNEKPSESVDAELPAESDKPQEPEDEQEQERQEQEIVADDAHLYAGADISVQASTVKGGFRLLIDDGLSKIIVPEYRVFITDTNGNTVRVITGIVGITKSLTIKELAPEFDFNIEVCAYAKNGTLLDSEKISFKTATDSSVTAKIYTVEYDVQSGTAYGFSSEQVLFGETATKAPTVYAPEGYKFTGWSVDGKNTVDLEKYNIYKDTVFTALYEKV